MRELERRFPPEFRNRIDEVVLFAPLTHDEVREIAKHYLDSVKMTLAKAGKTIQVDRRSAGAGRRQGLQHGVRRAIPEAVHRRADQAADQRALEGRQRTSTSSARDGALVVEPVGREDAVGGRDARLRRRRLRKGSGIADLAGFVRVRLHAKPPSPGEADLLRFAGRFPVRFAFAVCETVALLQHAHHPLDLLPVFLRRILPSRTASRSAAATTETRARGTS